MVNENKKHIVIFLYYSLKDPLCEGLMLSYLKALREDNTIFHLITYEQKKFAVLPEEMHVLKERLFLDHHIQWYPRQFTSGRFFLLKKGVSAIQGIRLVLKINRKSPLSLICGMATLAGTFAFIASRLLRVPYCQFTYEPHSLIMMESGRMSASSLRYKIARYFEKKIGLQSEYVACTTKHMVNDLKAMGAKGKLLRIPTSVDEDLNKFDEHARDKIRLELGLTSEPLIIYPGKFGGMYRQKATIELLTAWTRLFPSGHVLIITDYDLSEIQNWLSECNAEMTRFHLKSTVPLHMIPQYVSAADMGLIAYENFESRKYCSPVKTGEFLMCGVPILVQAGTSEDDEIALKNRVGAVLTTFDTEGLTACHETMKNLLSEDKTQLRQRCRETAISYRGKKNALQLMKDIFNHC